MAISRSAVSHAIAQALSKNALGETFRLVGHRIVISPVKGVIEIDCLGLADAAIEAAESDLGQCECCGRSLINDECESCNQDRASGEEFVRKYGAPSL